MVDVEKMSDAELRAELSARGVKTGPVTGTTRSIYEKKLKKLLDGKVQKTPVRATPAKKSKSPTITKKSIGNANTTLNSTQSSIYRRNVTRMEVEESDEDLNDSFEEEEEEIISPKLNRTAPPKRAISSTPTKIPPRTIETNKSTSKISNISKNDSINIPNLITSFDPNFSTISTNDRPGATPPRKFMGSSMRAGTKSNTRTSLMASSLISSPRNTFSSARKFPTSTVGMHDLGATTAEEDDEDEGLETSRVIYSTNDRTKKKGLIGKAWNKVLGYDFTTSSTPGQSYSLRAGNSRVRVVRDPKTGKFVVKETNVIAEAMYIALYVLIILFVVLTIGYFLSTSEKPRVAGAISVVTKTVRDTINFLYHYAILPVLFTVFVGLLGVGVYFGHKKYKEVKEKEESELFDLIERIIELIKESSHDGEPYISQPHIRDVLFPPAKRRGAELSRWEKAVEFIDVHESRVSTEIRVLPSGNECAIWKWIGNTQSKKNWEI